MPWVGRLKAYQHLKGPKRAEANLTQFRLHADSNLGSKSCSPKSRQHAFNQVGARYCLVVAEYAGPFLEVPLPGSIMPTRARMDSQYTLQSVQELLSREKCHRSAYHQDLGL